MLRMAQPYTDVADLSVTRQTWYRHGAPDGPIWPNVKKLHRLGKPDIQAVFRHRLVTEADHLKAWLCIIDGNPLWWPIFHKPYYAIVR
jgi:hypothetical protein